MSTRIYTMTHKSFNPPIDPIYIPLQVGRAGKSDLGYLGDDTGDNISELNGYYGELTGLYWLWKNRDFKGNIGICHYRRFFVNGERKLLNEAEYDAILSEYDVITSKAVYIDEPYREYYAQAHHGTDLELEGEVIRELYPEDYEVFERVMNGNSHYFGNLMVTSAQLFDSYCEWLFGIFAELEKRIKVDNYDEYHKRVFGFLSEQLLMVWVQARGLKVYESEVSLTDEKAETKELKLALGQLFKMGKISEARQLYYEVLKIRPDVRLEHSDVLGELPMIEQILYICECERQQGIVGMYDYSENLSELLAHVKKVIALLMKDEAWNANECKYLQQTNVTAVAVEVLAKNHADLRKCWEEILQKFCKYTQMA